MSSLMLKRSQNSCTKILLTPSFLSSQSRTLIKSLHSPGLFSFPPCNQNHKLLISGFSSFLLKTITKSSGSQFLRSKHHLSHSIWFCLFSTQTATELPTSGGLTIDEIVANNWIIVDESESDWKSHAAAIAQSIQVIKKRLQWKKLKLRVDLLSKELNKQDLWDHPVRAGKLSREHGSLMAKMKEVNAFERELLEHIDMIKLTREEDDTQLESVDSHLFF